MKGYRYLEEDDSDESDSEHSEEEEEDGEGQGAEEMDGEDGVGEQPAEFQRAASPAAPRRAAEIHHGGRDNIQGKEGEREERAGGWEKWGMEDRQQRRERVW